MGNRTSLHKNSQQREKPSSQKEISEKLRKIVDKYRAKIGIYPKDADNITVIIPDDDTYYHLYNGYFASEFIHNLIINTEICEDVKCSIIIHRETGSTWIAKHLNEKLII